MIVINMRFWLLLAFPSPPPTSLFIIIACGCISSSYPIWCRHSGKNFTRSNKIYMETTFVRILYAIFFYWAWVLPDDMNFIIICIIVIIWNIEWLKFKFMVQSLFGPQSAAAQPDQIIRTNVNAYNLFLHFSCSKQQSLRSCVYIWYFLLFVRKFVCSLMQSQTLKVFQI